MEQYSQEQLHTIEQLKTLRPQAADSVYLRMVRAKLLSTIESEQELVVRPWRWNAFSIAMRASVVLVVALMLGVGVSFASQYILPNNFLYPIKLASERMQLTLAGDGDASRIALQAKFAQTRITELQTLESTNQLDVQAVSNAFSQYMQMIDQIASSSQGIASSSDSSALSDLVQSEIRAYDLDSKINVLASSLQGKQLPQAIVDQVESAARASYSFRLNIADEIMTYESMHQTFAGDSRFVGRILFALSDDQLGLNALSDAATVQIQVDAHRLMQEQSALHPSVAPEKLIITLPQSDIALQQALVGIQQNMTSLEGSLSVPGASFNDSGKLDILSRVAGIKDALEQAQGLLSK